MKILELTAEQMDENCPFCNAEREDLCVSLAWDGARGEVCSAVKWQCGTGARADDRITRQSPECHINEIGEWVGWLADEIAELREGSRP